MIKKLTLMALQKAMNHALSLDDAMPSKIRPLNGKILEIIISPLEVSFFISFNETMVLLLPTAHQPPDTVIHSSPLGLIRLSLLPTSKARSLFNDKIRLSGDIELGEQVKKLFDDIDIDWEEHLSHLTGDVVAHQIGSLWREGLAMTERFKESLYRNVGEYLQEEARLSPPLEEVADFCNEVDVLSMDTDRIAARINQLTYRIKTNSSETKGCQTSRAS